MSIHESWERALSKTEIIRSRIKALATFEATHMPYVFIAESSINQGDCVVRKGEIVVEKPAIILPEQSPGFNGFEFKDDLALGRQFLENFFMVRGIRFPSMRYSNKTEWLDIFEGKLQKAISHYSDDLSRREDIQTGLVIGPEDTWQFSIIILICAQITRQAEGDIRRLLDEYKKRK